MSIEHKDASNVVEYEEHDANVVEDNRPVAKPKDGSKSVEVKQKRVPKLTEKGLAAKVEQLTKSRSAKLKQLTTIRNQIESLMVKYDNLEVISQMYINFTVLIEDFSKIQCSIYELLPKEEKEDDHAKWYLPKLARFNEFKTTVKKWKQDATTLAQEHQITGVAEEHTSVASLLSKVCQSSTRSSHRSSTASSSRRKAEAERAVLMVQAKGLKKKLALEREEAELTQNIGIGPSLIETQLAAADAKIKVYDELDGRSSTLSRQKETVKRLQLSTMGQRMMLMEKRRMMTTKMVVMKEMNLQMRRNAAAQLPGQSSNAPSGEKLHVQAKGPTSKTELLQLPVSYSGKHAHDKHSADTNLMKIMQKQNEITEMLIKEQRFSTLPSKEIPVFKGDPLQYLTFISTFEHCIEGKTSNEQDRLFFLDQYTEGQPKLLVRSCLHMEPEKGYNKAKQLLQKCFGNDILIASAYQEKALNWPVVKSEDRTALQEYAYFMRSCGNAMIDMEALNDMNNTSHMRTFVSKLPFKLREKWRGKAYEYYERTQARAKFMQLISFIERQANMACDPLFGNIQDVTPKDDRKKFPKVKSGSAFKSSFTTVTTEEPLQNPTPVTISQPRICLFCKKDHATETCKELNGKKREEKVEFFKANGICFGCINKGHLSKDCRKRLSCKVCSLKHPTMLHIEINKPEEIKRQNAARVTSVNSSLVSLEKPVHTGAGDNQTLAIVPVKVKLSSCNKIIQTYAFLDPGGTATFCTTTLQRQLNAKGRKTRILLKTLGHEKIVNVNRISGLEVSNLGGDDFIALPAVYTQEEIPVTKEQIPTSGPSISKLVIRIRIIQIMKSSFSQTWIKVILLTLSEYFKTPAGWITAIPIWAETDFQIS
ncbi:hypothetical protein N1851_022154 [Merluccius polli]|uniref:CCHC-type domain-containing protein n=1 Tax=Merluccius polli TaxID=89951 RepID=A0AA47MIN8_MERPO|nr:hypothetical protein N1851_022154 [Merluccius polli]